MEVGILRENIWRLSAGAGEFNHLRLGGCAVVDSDRPGFRALRLRREGYADDAVRARSYLFAASRTHAELRGGFHRRNLQFCLAGVGQRDRLRRARGAVLLLLEVQRSSGREADRTSVQQRDHGIPRVVGDGDILLVVAIKVSQPNIGGAAT